MPLGQINTLFANFQVIIWWPNQSSFIGRFIDFGNILKVKRYLDRFFLKKEITFEPRHKIFNNEVYASRKASDQPVQARNLIRAIASRLNLL